MTNVIATTSDGGEIEAGDWLVVGGRMVRGERVDGDDLDIGQVNEDGTVGWSGGNIETLDAATMASLERENLAVYTTRAAAESEIRSREAV